MTMTIDELIERLQEIKAANTEPDLPGYNPGSIGVRIESEDGTFDSDIQLVEQEGGVSLIVKEPNYEPVAPQDDSLEAFIRRRLVPYQIDWDGDNKTGYLADLERQPVSDHGLADVVASTALYSPAKRPEHKLILDIDHPAWLVESSTPGHYHLYIDCPTINHELYMAIVAALGAAGVIEPGYAMASVRRGHTDLRPPWVKKGEEPGRKRNEVVNEEDPEDEIPLDEHVRNGL